MYLNLVKAVFSSHALGLTLTWDVFKLILMGRGNGKDGMFNFNMRCI